jgi:S1-C subfamily serine protease
LQLTEGPKEWISLKGRNRGQYWLLSAKHFHVDLDRLSDVFTGAIDTASAATQDAPASMTSDTEGPIKQAVLRARPAVVQLKGVKKSGSGFFVTATGVVATNAHVARGESSFTAILSDGRKLEAKVVDIEEHTDIALLKINGQDFPHLIVRADLPETADTVIAIGNPAGGMAGSISKGVVSAVGKFSEAGPGTWIETDAVINPGNSGGPLLNIRGEVIGITSGRLATKNGGGLTFALCSTELRAVLDRFYHGARPPSGLSSMASREAETPESYGTVSFPGPEGAEIYIDGEHYGTAPASIRLSLGTHSIAIKREGHADTLTFIKVTKNSQQRVQPHD